MVRNQKPHKLKTRQLDSGINFLGVVEDVNFPYVSYRLKQDDIIFSCSDGLSEQLNDEKIMYIEKLETTLKEFDTNLDKNRRIILDDWNSFRQNRKVRDDVSFFIVKL